MRNPLDIWRILNGPCRDMTALISRSMDERLGFWERFGYKLHLLYCRACRRYRKQLVTLRAVIRAAASDATESAAAPGATLSPDARKRIQDAIQEG